ncbi:hypothetical protein CN689_14340 [Peribacillus butanolivorans]|uniref:Uncharacterized protein n=1 Tax=Peribacillus butanolivorans TaxID=421767 RepID=A0AAX0RRL2_9BACI|nr:hypothetical protein [Peribacillus butanolivorans]PEJ32304.1 hypothetical protein CN689_14340 [Peribacillus butanolivorans]
MSKGEREGELFNFELSEYYFGGINHMSKVHTVKFYSFKDGTFNVKKKEKRKAIPNINMYSVSPFVMLDPVICLMGVGLLSIALLEKFFEHQGNYDVSESLHTCFNIAIPCVAFGFIWKLMISVSGVFL